MGDGFNVALKKEVLGENHIHLDSARVDKFIVKLQKNGKREFINVASINASV
jgi:hypothetical protein